MNRRIPSFFSALKSVFFYPALNDFPFLLLVWAFFSFPEFMVQVMKGNYYYSILYLFLYFGVTYIFTLIVDLTKFTRKFLKPLCFLILSVFTLVNIYCLYKYRTRLSYNIIEIIGGTNLDEAKEYLRMYVDFYEYLIIVISFMITVGLFILTLKLPARLKINPIFVSLLLFCSIISFFINPTLKDEFVTWDFNFEDIADLTKYKTNPRLDIRDSLPEYVVVILGESHAKSHSSLYGYEKNTNPLLQNRKDSNDLYVFKNVVSPAVNTSNSFKYILNSHRKDLGSAEKWYKSTNIIEVLNRAGFSTHWLSNQARQGLYNNLSSAPAKLCDDATFIREFSNDLKYDGELLDLPRIENGNHAYFYHLMGQHFMFNERYPENFEKFRKEDYDNLNLDNDKKLLMAQYDNANLYNDFVVNSIIEKFKDKDAVIFYFPDHGLDVYESDPDYCGHAIISEKSEKVGIQIPFLVYLSSKYKSIRPELAERINESVNKEFMTDKFIYSVMDASGIHFANNNEVEEYSLFR